MLNPQVYNINELQFLEIHEILISIYQLQLASVLLFYATVFFVFLFLLAKFILPKYWYKDKIK